MQAVRRLTSKVFLRVRCCYVCLPQELATLIYIIAMCLYDMVTLGHFFPTIGHTSKVALLFNAMFRPSQASCLPHYHLSMLQCS